MKPVTDTYIKVKKSGIWLPVFKNDCFSPEPVTFLFGISFSPVKYTSTYPYEYSGSTHAFRIESIASFQRSK